MSRNVGTLFDAHIYWKYFVIVWIALLTGMTMIRTVKSLGPFATVATILLSLSLFIILIGACVSWHLNITSNTSPKLRLFDISNVPNMIGVAIFSFEGIGFILPAHTAIKKRSHFTPLIVVCITFIASLYVIFGTIGYLGFGDSIQDIALNSFDVLPGQAWAIIRKITLVAILLAIFVTYPMQMFVALDILENKLFDPAVRTRKKWWIQNLFRFCVVLLTALVALVVPKLNTIMAFIGSLGSAPLQYIFPSTIYILIYRDEINIATKALIGSYVVIGFVALIFGTYTSLRDIVLSY
ncbi:proton-coupled amino acid transporter 4-like [Schistocerca gregaria]|uniref:proton-coupled amino acid transporter 4-like n=1 Tax=Schistocerca gregaria TaxID=7010 RepID=UPI00211E7023|nr:proton-coupled amino acid transporter 4-like [Schistocerca gregaria]